MDPGEATSTHHRYKGKLCAMCLKGPVKTQRLSGALDGRRWRFLRPGLDDFRDGYPPTHTKSVPQLRSGAVPAVFGLSSPAGSARVNKKRLSKEQTCFTKQNCVRHARRQHVDAVEQRLKTHALVLYPHLESGMTPELFDDVLSVLDPDMLVKREEIGEDVRRSESNNPVPTEEPSKPDSKIPKKEQLKSTKLRNPYKWSETNEGVKEDKMVGATLTADDDVMKVTKQLCDWVTSLGGETNDMSESSILSLFASRPKEKSALPIPNQTLDPHQIPQEVWKSVKSQRKGCSPSTQLKDSEINKVYSRNVKSDPNTWRKQSAKKPQRDPTVTEDLETMKQPTEKDEELKLSHGTQAFKQYIISKGLRMPQFLSLVFSDEEVGEQDQRDGKGSPKREH